MLYYLFILCKFMSIKKYKHQFYDKTSLDMLVSHLDNVSLWQTKEWQQMVINAGDTTSDSAILVSEWSGNQIWSALQIRRVGLGQYGWFVIGGPIVIWNDDELFTEHMKELQSWSLKHGLIFLSFEPLEWKVEDILLKQKNVKKWFWKKFIEPYTRIIRLDQSYDKILMDMHEKGRYNIRLGEKRGVTVSNNSFSEENIDSFYDLLKDTAKRDGFAINSRSTFESLVSLQSDMIEVRLFEARHPLYIDPIASSLYIACGDMAYYYYGASVGDSEAKKLMASFVIQWAMIQYAGETGRKVYDFLGVAPEDKKKHHLAGVTYFKSRFGGEVVKFPNGCILVLSWKYYLLWIVRWVRFWR